MDWNPKGIFVKGLSVDELVALLPGQYARTGELMSFDEAIAGLVVDDLAVGQVGDWVAFWDPDGIIMSEESLHQKLAKRGPVLAVLFSGDADTFGFWWYAPGGQLLRQYVWQDGQEVESEGTPLLDEVRLTRQEWDYETEWMLPLVEHLTGLTWERIEAAEWEALEQQE